MTVFYDLDRANARLPELRETLLALQAQRAQLIELRDRVLQLHAAADSVPTQHGSAEAPGDADEARLLELRMQAIVDQMQSAVAEIDGWGIQLRDIDSGLVDFPALVAGRQVWLCWRLGEDRVAWWHEMAGGFAGRQRLEDLH